MNPSSSPASMGDIAAFHGTWRPQGGPSRRCAPVLPAGVAGCPCRLRLPWSSVPITPRPEGAGAMSYTIPDILELVRYHLVLSEDDPVRSDANLARLISGLDEMASGPLL